MSLCYFIIYVQDKLNKIEQMSVVRCVDSWTPFTVISTPICHYREYRGSAFELYKKPNHYSFSNGGQQQVNGGGR